jgi:hypothetical protein
VESYIVRIYRRDVADPERLIGVVEHPERGTRERFHDAAGLLHILLTPCATAEIITTLEATGNHQHNASR